MSKISISGNASGTGTLTIAAPNTNTDRTLTLPDATGTLNTSGAVNEVPAGSASAPAIYPTGDSNTGIFFPAADTIAFAEGGAEAMRIDSSGNVLIGGTSTAALDGVFGTVIGGTSKSTAGVAVETSTSQWLTYTDSSQAMLFYDARLNTERARITSGGAFLVGKTTINDDVEGLHINSSGIIEITTGNSGTTYPIAFYRSGSGTSVGYISTTAGATQYVTSSDYRLKENIAPMTGALNTVARLNPVTYTWKTDGSTGQGFIAHELQAVVPDCVVGEKDAVDEDGNPKYQGVDTSFLVATLTAAIQELKAITDAQTTRIEALEAEVAALKG